MTEPKPGTGGKRYVPYEERSGNESIVYFTRDLSPEGLMKIYERVNGTIRGKTGVKLHTGEPHGPNIIPSSWVKEFMAKGAADLRPGCIFRGIFPGNKKRAEIQNDPGKGRCPGGPPPAGEERG